MKRDDFRVKNFLLLGKKSFSFLWFEILYQDFYEVWLLVTRTILLVYLGLELAVALREIQKDLSEAV